MVIFVFSKTLIGIPKNLTVLFPNMVNPKDPFSWILKRKN